MNLPNCQNAVVPEEKLTGYLLSPTHRDGRHKAVFFAKFGFTADNWRQLAQALLVHATRPLARIEESPFGKRYVIEDILQAADGPTPMLRSVWFVETDEDTPRFVTAYPLRSDSDD